jgi:hypothetical protein
VAAKSPVAIASGEGLFTRFEFRSLLEARGASIIQPDVLHAGGITELRKIANLAESYGVEVAPHQCSGPIAHVASLAAMSVCRNFLIQEWEAADDAVYQELTEGTYPVQQNGSVALSDRAGLGIQVNLVDFAKRFPFKTTRRRALINLRRACPFVLGLPGKHRLPAQVICSSGKGAALMGSISVACYRPKPGCEDALRELVRNHLPPLRAEGLVTDRPSMGMRTQDGTIVEVFEWVSQEAIAGAHTNPAVLELWKKFEAVLQIRDPLQPSGIPENVFPF